MGATKTQITNLLEMRFDYQSARNVLNNWRKFAQIKEDPDPMTDVQLVSLLEYLKANAPDAARVHAAVERLILAQDVAQTAQAHVEEHHEVHHDEHHEEHHEEVHYEEHPAAQHVENVENVETADVVAEGCDNADNADNNDSNDAPAESKENKKNKKKKH